MGLTIHFYWPMPGTVKAVKCLDCLSKGICQNPDVRSRVVKIVDPDLPMSPLHSLMSFMEYLLYNELALRSLKSCTTLKLPFFFGTMNRGCYTWTCWVGWVPFSAISLPEFQVPPYVLPALGIVFCGRVLHSLFWLFAHNCLPTWDHFCPC